MANKSAEGNLVTSPVKAQPAKITAEVVIRDKDGKVKYQGPINMEVKEIEDGCNSPDRS